MLERLGQKFTDLFKKNMPDAFVFALILTLITAVVAMSWMKATPLEVLTSWYDGFYLLLEFGMQMVLLIVTGYSIALSSTIQKGIDKLSGFLKTPGQVYFFVVLVGLLLSMISWGWVIITAVLARHLALRVKGIHYPYLIACVYFSMISWVTGLSSSIPLLLNTPDNYLIEEGILTETIASENTLGSAMNFGMIATILILGPLFMWLLAPKKKSDPLQLADMLETEQEESLSINEEAESARLPFKALSDFLNNSVVLQYIIGGMGAVFLGHYFLTKGFDLNLNIMIFVFIVLGLFLHRTPMRFTIAMRRASTNVSAIIFQFPFYAGIMGIMTYTGLGEHLGQVMAEAATLDTYPYFAFALGGIVNFAIPSAGGEFAVIGPSVIEAIQQLGQGLPPEALLEMTSRASMAIAYGEALTNCLQPFFLLLIIPVMAKGIKIQARDVMGYLVIPFLVFFLVQGILVGLLPL